MMVAKTEEGKLFKRTDHSWSLTPVLLTKVFTNVWQSMSWGRTERVLTLQWKKVKIEYLICHFETIKTLTRVTPSSCIEEESLRDDPMESVQPGGVSQVKKKPDGQTYTLFYIPKGKSRNKWNTSLDALQLILVSRRSRLSRPSYESQIINSYWTERERIRSYSSGLFCPLSLSLLGLYLIIKNVPANANLSYYGQNVNNSLVLEM